MVSVRRGAAIIIRSIWREEQWRRGLEERGVLANMMVSDFLIATVKADGLLISVRSSDEVTVIKIM